MTREAALVKPNGRVVTNPTHNEPLAPASTPPPRYLVISARIRLKRPHFSSFGDVSGHFIQIPLRRLQRAPIWRSARCTELRPRWAAHVGLEFECSSFTRDGPDVPRPALSGWTDQNLGQLTKNLVICAGSRFK